MAELLDVLALLDALGAFFVPTEAVAECRDAKDDKYLELALAARAEVIVSGDDDLLVLHPCCAAGLTRAVQRQATQAITAGARAVGRGAA